jgi:hypothetical protein
VLIVKFAMLEKPSALPTVPAPPPAADEYDTICATVMGSGRGRWFLDEYMRRNRNVETGLVLAAVERIEAAIRDGGGPQAHHNFRADLLEMAKAIIETRAEVAEIKPEPRAQGKAAGDDAPPAPASAGILAAAERIQDVAWTMRERGIDPQTCEQIEALASSILSASSLPDPDDHRAHKLSEVLQYLERRIAAMLVVCTEPGRALAEQAPAEHAPTNGRAIDPALPSAAEPAIVQDAAPATPPPYETPDALVDDEPDLFEAPVESAFAIPEPEWRSEPSPTSPPQPMAEAAAAVPSASAPGPQSTRADDWPDADEVRRLIGAQLDVDLLVVAPAEPRPTTAPPSELEHAPIAVRPLFEAPHPQAPAAPVAPPTADSAVTPAATEIPPTVDARPQHGFDPPELAVVFLMENAGPASADTPMVERPATGETTAPSRSEPPAAPDTAAAAPPHPAEPPPPATDEPSAEPADFLLEPLPPPAMSSVPPAAAAAPEPSSPPPQRTDPLAALRAMSSEERIALFT